MAQFTGYLLDDIASLFNPSGEDVASQRQQEVQGLFGSPVRVDGSMQSAEFDAQGNPINIRSSVQAPDYSQSTGLFRDLPQERIPAMQAVKQMAMSGEAGVRKTGYSALEDLMKPAEAQDLSMARTFAMGAPPKIVDGVNVNEGKMIRAMPADNEQGYETFGSPYDPRNPYLNVGTGFVNPNQPNSTVPINLSQAEFNKKQGVADQEFMNNYSVNIDKGEAGLEAMDFLTSGLDELANSATGWSTGLGSVLTGLPTSDATAWKALQTSVLSGLGLDKMAELKSLSSTGSTGFGALNEKELELLVSYRGKLEQATTPKQIKGVIRKMQRLISNSRKRTVRNLKNAQKRFEKLVSTRGYDPTGEARLPDNLEPKSNNVDDLVNKYAN